MNLLEASRPKGSPPPEERSDRLFTTAVEVAVPALPVLRGGCAEATSRTLVPVANSTGSRLERRCHAFFTLASRPQLTQKSHLFGASRKLSPLLAD